MALTKATALAVSKKAAAFYDAQHKLPHAGFDVAEVMAADTDDVESLRDTDRLKADVNAYLKARADFVAAVEKAAAELWSGYELVRDDDGRWVLMTLGPSGVTTRSFETKEDAEAAVEAHLERVAKATEEV